MERRDFLRTSVRTMFVTTGLFIAGKVIVSCDKDDDRWNGYYDGYYGNGYYDDGYYDDGYYDDGYYDDGDYDGDRSSGTAAQRAQ